MFVVVLAKKNNFQLMTSTPSSFTSGEKMVWQEGTRDASIALCDLKEKVAGFEYPSKLPAADADGIRHL